MLRVGLTGGIAAGKSVASRRFAELGAVLVDHDVLAREVVAPGSNGLRDVVRTFGAGVLDETGALDRAALGRLVFDDPAARGLLNAVVHPRVRAAAAEAERAALAAGEAVVVHDIPLLVESGQVDRFDVVVVVDAPAAMRRARLVASRGLTEAEAQARLDAQASDEERRAAADVLLDGSGSVTDLQQQVDALWATWRTGADGAYPEGVS